ncbi:peptidoglycan editing factor PgeF [Aliikangiella sp. G2MR2-5]|uniref:peptidoglycan editing factor PgeF n=1 Tax=Aliikangiella sp. G2MR2-5 TaxID=2788943 RepID=UPI0018AA45A1|nr:peptidoglycan editing factor PgeF [Aliikangiella sp. G2MR2-5]
MFELIKPDWDIPERIKAFSTTRQGGVSEAQYSSLNLADHVGDRRENVFENRQLLIKNAQLPSEPFWLEQVHGIDCIEYGLASQKIIADACFSRKPNQVCVVMTADCLPVLLASRKANWVAACHAGWRGLLGGIIEKTVALYSGEKQDICAWVGPAITQPHFEVGREVRDAFYQQNIEAKDFFIPNQRGRFQFNFIGLAMKKLNRLGISVFGGDHCSFEQSSQFFSYRRDGQTGRMASLIWLSE